MKEAPQAQGKSAGTEPKQSPQTNAPLMESAAVQRVFAMGGSSGGGDLPPWSPSDITYLQAKAGNRAVQRLLNTSARQGNVQRAQASSVGAEGGPLHQGIEARINQSHSGGSPMPERVRNILQPKLQADLKNVRVHTDQNAVQLARQLNAQAFTHKNHIYYGAGKSPSDLRLTAHETVHTIQQGAVARQMDTGIQRKPAVNNAQPATPAIQQSGPATIQRLPTAAQLEGTAGQAKGDWKVGKFTLRRMSSKYKAVLDALRHYDAVLDQRVGGDIHGYNIEGAWDLNAQNRLETVEDAVDRYLAAHQDDERSAEIRKVKEEIPVERAILQAIGERMDQYANLTGRQAVAKERIVHKAMAKAKENQSGFGSGVAKTELTSVVSGTHAKGNQSLTEEIGTAKGAWGLKEGQVGDAFRGSDVLSKASATYAKGNFLPYYLNTVMPAFADVIRAIQGSGIREIKTVDDKGNEQVSDDAEANAMIARVYKRFAIAVVRGLPEQLIDAASTVYGRIRKATKTDAPAFSKKLASSAATNTIYVRCFGPALNTMSGFIRGDLTLPEQQAVTAVIQLLAKQGPGMNLRARVVRSDEYYRLGAEPAIQEAAAEYQRVLDRIVARGEELAV